MGMYIYIYTHRTLYASNAFNSIKKYVFFEKLQLIYYRQCHFVHAFFFLNFFSKNSKFRFFKILKISIFIDFSQKNRENDFLKNRNFGLFEKFFENIF